MLSICIVTYKRIDLLLSLLRELDRQSNISGVDVIVVDNDIQKSAAIVKKKTYKYELKYIPSKINNISHARNIAINAACTDYLTFIDDDSMPINVNWVSELLASINESKADVIHGPVLPKYVDCNDFIIKTKYFERPSARYGATKYGFKGACNSTINKKFIIANNITFNTEFGITGGEDSLLFSEIELAGGHFFWNAKAPVYEIYDSSRCNIKWMIKRSFRGGNTYYKKLYYLKLLNISEVLKTLVITPSLFCLLFFLPVLILINVHFSTFVFRKFFEYCGRLAYTLKMEYNEYG